MPPSPTLFRVTLLDTLAEDPAYGLGHGVMDYCAHAPHWRMIGDDHGVFMPYERIDPEQVDGVLGRFSLPESMRRLMDMGIPVVTVSTQMDDPPLPYVCSDSRAIGRMAADYLLERGFTQYGFIHRRTSRDVMDRLEAFREVVEEGAGQPCHIIRMPEVPESQERDAMAAALKALPKPIAIMATDDRIGRRTINMALTLGLRVPDDVAVLGVRNDRWETEMAATPMSSIDVGRHQIGYRAAQMLDRMMAGEAPSPSQLVPPIGVVTRKSTDITVCEDPIVTKALSYIRDYCAHGVTVEDVLDHVRVSRRTLENRMKQAVGHTPNVAIRRAQIRQAQKMLTESQATMAQIARACGVGRQDYFCAMFKKQTGMTPGQYRRQQRRSV